MDRRRLGNGDSQLELLGGAGVKSKRHITLRECYMSIAFLAQITGLVSQLCGLLPGISRLFERTAPKSLVALLQQ